MTKAEERTLQQLIEENIPDHRKGNAIKYELSEVIMIGILSILCNGLTFKAMEIFGKTHERELRGLMGLKHGIPSHDTFGDVFKSLDPNAVSKVFGMWLRAVQSKLPDGNHGISIAIDGKTIRRSGNKAHKASHVVTAFSSELQLVLGQLCTEEKSNEITAIPQLLDLLMIKDCTVTIDAMGTQREIAAKIREKKGDYILGLKGNQGDLLEFAKLHVQDELKAVSRKELSSLGRYTKTVEKGHGRIETRECFLFPGSDWYDRAAAWSGLAGIAMIRSSRTLASGETTTEDRYYIYSKEDLTAPEFLTIQRSHWGIENSLHWTLDMTFREDSAHVRLGNAAVVLNIFRKLVMQMLKSDTSIKDSVSSKLLRCSWDFDYALRVVANCPFPFSA